MLAFLSAQSEQRQIDFVLCKRAMKWKWLKAFGNGIKLSKIVGAATAKTNRSQCVNRYSNVSCIFL